MPAAVPPAPAPDRWLVLAVLATGLLLIAMDATILNVALPTLAADLEPGSSELLWIVDAYGLVLAGLLVAMGALGDRIGRRRLLVAGLAVFAAANALGALADSPGQLIAARVLLGVGGAMVMPSTVSVLRVVFTDDRERATAIGVWTAVAAGGFAVGPIVGGALLEVASWPWVFAVQVPVALAVLVVARRRVPESRDPDPSPWDPMGVGMSIGGMVALLWGVKEAGSEGLDAPAAPAALVLGAVLLALFVRRQARAPRPLLDVGLFRSRRFSASALAVLATFFGLGALLFLLTQFLQIVEGHSPLEAGVRLLPIAVGAAVAAPLTDRVVRRFGAHVAVGGGFASVAAGLAALAPLEAGSSYLLVAVALALIGIGAGIASSAASAAILAAAPPEKAGGAAAIQETAFELGGALGVAIIGSVMGAAYRGALGPLPGVPAEAAGAVRDGLPGAAEAARGIGGSAGDALLARASDAFVDGFGPTTIASAAVMALVALAALVGMPRARGAHPPAPTPAPAAVPAPHRATAPVP